MKWSKIDVPQFFATISYHLQCSGPWNMVGQPPWQHAEGELDTCKRAICKMPSFWQVDGFGNILFCCHGLKFLKSEEIAAKYPNKFLQVYQPRLLGHYLPWDLIAAWREEDLCVQHLVQPTRDLSARLPHWFLPDEQKLQGVSGPSPSNAQLPIHVKSRFIENPWKGEGWLPRRRPAHVLQVCLPRCARLCWLCPHGGGEGWGRCRYHSHLLSG